eukprot:TRINITY_DN25558_c0_g1_i1.p1 TRINITY_DN25558_c0_g1~~TRINITY_DN25558_c0_g1_i1.p1  ORF type:complete len:251 (-),score=36.13 TRINITY_DN25558_c0_g1_i1:75-827(-)
MQSSSEPHGVVTFEQILQGALGQEELQRANEYLNDPDAYRRTAVGYNDMNTDVQMIDREEMYDMRVTLRRLKYSTHAESREDDSDMRTESKPKPEGSNREQSKGSLKKDQKSNDSSDRGVVGGSSGVAQQAEKKQQVQKKKSSANQSYIVPPGWTIIKPKKTDGGSTQRAFQSPDGIVFQSLQSAYYYWTNELDQVHPIEKEDTMKENVTIQQLTGVIRTIGIVGMEGGYLRSWDMKRALDKVKIGRAHV